MGKVTKLSKVAKYSKKKINAAEVSLENFVTTDSILQNKAGITFATNLPPSDSAMSAYSAGNILVGNIRPYLKKIWFANHNGGCSADVLIFEVNEGYDQKFVYYSLFRDDFFNHMMKGKKGTKMPRGDKKQIMGFLIPEFELPTQQKIAAVLSALDAKIELNQRLNAELESIAKTLYDYWFVQFDFPNEKGKPYKSSGGMMVWNEKLKRDIPLGWNVESIEKCCSVIDCLHAKKPDYQFEDERYFVLQLENIRDDGLLDLANKYYVTKDDYELWTSRILVSEDDLIITNAGRVAATAQIPNGIKTSIGRNITGIRPTSINPTYLFWAFRGWDMKRQIKWNTDAGSFFSSLNVKGIRKLFVVRPQNDIEGKFEEIVKPMRYKRETNNAESQTLTELRDWLLPMLMNGQVKVA